MGIRYKSCATAAKLCYKTDSNNQSAFNLEREKQSRTETKEGLTMCHAPYVVHMCPPKVHALEVWSLAWSVKMW